MNRHLLALSAVLAVTACASTHGAKTAQDTPPASPTTQFAVTVTHSADEILLAPHHAGLSPAQAEAVVALVDRWRDAGDGPITIQSPVGGGADAYGSVSAVQAALQRNGLPDDQVRLVSYQPQAPGAGVTPVVVGFNRDEAHGPQCGRDWKDFTKTYANKPNSNFGCAVTANFAAMIANPADLTELRRMDPPDANRRETILGKYRKGETTSAAKDTQASGVVSSVLQ